MKFGTLQQILDPMTVTLPKIEILKIQDGDSLHLENRFLGHNSLQTTVVRLQQNFATGSKNGMSTKAM